tara:strand:- start:186 stop:395 length:210 start_codon:yes stop_codon:yes gene_type:complete
VQADRERLDVCPLQAFWGVGRKPEAAQKAKATKSGKPEAAQKARPTKSGKPEATLKTIELLEFNRMRWV